MGNALVARQEGNKATAGTRPRSARRLTRQIARSTRATTFGGREAARSEESEQQSVFNQSLQEEEWSSDPGQLFDQVTQRYTQGFARQQLEEELRKLGLELTVTGVLRRSSKGLDQQVVEAFMSVVHEFRDFKQPSRRLFRREMPERL